VVTEESTGLEVVALEDTGAILVVSLGSGLSVVGGGLNVSVGDELSVGLGVSVEGDGVGVVGSGVGLGLNVADGVMAGGTVENVGEGVNVWVRVGVGLGVNVGGDED
jgi:hypothetical protein